jgi:redox-sensitive bicupin YhaK (pirin superfamily)
VRLIAGELAGHPGPGDTHTPITYAHATVSPGAQLTVPWNPTFSAFAYVLLGQGYAGDEGRPVAEHQLVLYGAGDTLTIRAADHQEGPTDALEVLLLGGLPIGEPIAHYGPFVMNTREEIVQAVDDFNAGRMGVVPTG